MFMLVRTDNSGKKQQGITFLLLDRMDYPGMTVRPIVGLDGFPEQCEVFFEDVRVPQSGRVGAENDGWSVAKHLLKHERGGGAQSPTLKRGLERIREAAQTTPSGFGTMLAEDPVFQRDIGELEADIASFEHFEKLAVSGHPIASDPAYPSMNKTMNSELTQRVTLLLTQAVGNEALPLQLEALRVGANVEPLGSDLDLIAMPWYLNSRATTIYAGSNEVQRDLIARTVGREG
jgi:alkylation response protein AidB-like acyl-CoA dehydrogenase